MALGDSCNTFITCNNEEQRTFLDIFYNDIASALSEASKSSYTASLNGRKKSKLWVRISVAEDHRMARLASITNTNNKWCQQHQKQIKMDRLATLHSYNKFREFENNQQI